MQEKQNAGYGCAEISACGDLHGILKVRQNGDEVDPEDDINYLTDNWIEVFRSGKFPMKPFEKYFENGMTVSGCLMRSIRLSV